MSVITLTPTNVVYSEDGSIDVEIFWGGAVHAKHFPDQAALVAFATLGFEGPEEIIRAAVNAWAALDPACLDTSDFLDRDIHLHFGQDLQGNGNADLHLLWKKGGPT